MTGLLRIAANGLPAACRLAALVLPLLLVGCASYSGSHLIPGR